MRQFDALLRRGLMEANLAQYEEVLRNAESRELNASAQYCRERMRLLAAPGSWEKRQTRLHRKRLDWRLLALIAALLLLSACAYIVATGQFAQWFPGVRTNPNAPQASEDVMARMGTVIQQSLTADGVTLTLHAAVWDGNSVRLSFAAEGPDFPEALPADSWLCAEECRIAMPEEQWKDYVRKEAETRYAGSDSAKDLLEESIQYSLDRGQSTYWSPPSFLLTGLEENRLTFEATVNLGAYLERPELTVHIEHMAICGEGPEWTAEPYEGTAAGPGVPILEGPYAFTFVLEEPVMPVIYEGSVSMTCGEVPLKIKRIHLSVFGLEVDYDILMPVNILRPGDTPDPDKLNIGMENQGPRLEVRGFWTEDGQYTDCAESCYITGITVPADGAEAGGSAGCQCPYAIDPATVTAVDLSGTRVELDGWRLLTEKKAVRKFSFW